MALPATAKTTTTVEEVLLGSLDKDAPTVVAVTAQPQPAPKAVIEDSRVVLEPATVRARVEKQLIKFGLITPNNAAVPVTVTVKDTGRNVIVATYNLKLATGRHAIEHVYSERGSGSFEVVVETLD